MCSHEQKIGVVIKGSLASKERSKAVPAAKGAVRFKMSIGSYLSEFHNYSMSPDVSMQDSSVSISDADVSSLANIEETIAKSHMIIKQSIELTKLNTERKEVLKERVKALIPKVDLAKTGVVPKVNFDLVQNTKRTDFTVRSSSKASAERSPAKENLSFDEMVSEDSLHFTFDKEPKQATYRDLRTKLHRQRENSIRLREEQASIMALSSHAQSLKDVVDSQNKEINRLRNSLGATQAELSKVVQKLSDKEIYVKSIEEEIEAIRARKDRVDAKDTPEFRALQEQYSQLLKRFRTEQSKHKDSHIQLEETSSFPDGERQQGRRLEEQRSEEDERSEPRIVGKVRSLEEKLGELEDRYHQQLLENCELRKKLVSILEKTDQARDDDYRNFTANSDSKQALAQLLNSDSSIKKPPKKLSLKIKPPTSPKKPHKCPKKPKKREASLERARPCKFHCCGKCM
mmetsp:Transcript_27118/g.48660  ORF Transcript_27118/g.48660 Transcript_27118/m.48660 type:complete len:458 (+) Transcript_27118:242-1615(+)